MRRVNNLFLVVSIVLFCNSIYAQKNSWTLDFRTGYKIQVLEKTTSPILEIKSTFGDGVGPSFCFINLAYNVNDKISFGSGIGFLIYQAAWRTGKAGTIWVNSRGGEIIFRNLQIPLNLKYAIPLRKSNFNIYGKLGLGINIPIYAISTTIVNDNGLILTQEYLEYGYEYEQTEKVYGKKINILLNAGVGMAYRFKNGIGLSLEGEYYAGLRTMGHVLINIKQRTFENPVVLKESTNLLLIKGSYWNFSLGISYTFKKKAKNKKEEILPEDIENSIE